MLFLLGQEPETDSPVLEVVRTYKVEVRPLLGESFAREIAARYGISCEQLEKTLEERGTI